MFVAKQMLEDRPNYDTTQFIADVGGSLGFLLGLSVLGLIGILEHVRQKLAYVWKTLEVHFEFNVFADNPFTVWWSH